MLIVYENSMNDSAPNMRDLVLPGERGAQWGVRS